MLDSNIEAIGRVIAEIRERTNVTLEYSTGSWNTNEFVSSLKKQKQSGNLPDIIFPPSRSAARIMAREEMIVSADFIKRDFPQFYFSFEENDWVDGQIDGNNYGVPFRIFEGPVIWIVDGEKRKAVADYPLSTFAAIERKAKEYSKLTGKKNLLRHDRGDPSALFRHLLYLEKGWRPLPSMNNSMILFLKENEPQVFSLFNEMNNEIYSILRKAINLYQEQYYFGQPPRNGPIYSFMTYNPLTADEWFAYRVSSNSFLMDPYYTQGAVTNLSGYEFVYDKNGGRPPYTIDAVNHLYLGNTKQIPRVIDFLSTLQSREFFELIQYGVPGIDWISDEDGSMELLPDSRYPTGSYWRNPLLVLSTNFQFWRDNSRWPESLNNIVSNFISDFWEGPEDLVDQVQFNFNTVNNELDIFREKLYENYYLELFKTTEELEYRWDQFRDAGEDVIEVIRNNLQKQLDDYLSDKRE